MDYNFGQKQSPYMERRDRTFGRPNGRPTGSTGTTGGSPPVGVSRIPSGQAGSEGDPRHFGPGNTGTSSQAGTSSIGGTGSGVSSTMQQSPYASFLAGLAKPVAFQDQSQQRWNLAREREQGITKLGLEQGAKYFGGRNLVPGESGIADTGMGKIATAGMERMSAASRQVALDEAGRRQQYDRMNLERQMGGAQIALTGEEGALNRQFGYYRSKQDAERGAWDAWRQSVAGGY